MKPSTRIKLGGEVLKKFTQIGGLVSGFVSLPVISKFIIRDSIPLSLQFIVLLTLLLVVVSILAGIFYLRNSDLESSKIELKEENKVNTLKLETKYDNEIKSLKDQIIGLENNREGLKDMINNEKQENSFLRSQVALYSYSYPVEKRRELQEAATLLLTGGTNNGSESNQDHQ